MIYDYSSLVEEVKERLEKSYVQLDEIMKEKDLALQEIIKLESLLFRLLDEDDFEKTKEMVLSKIKHEVDIATERLLSTAPNNDL